MYSKPKNSHHRYVPEKERNSLERSQLVKQMLEIKKEQRADLRMLETSKSQFRLKFLKYEPVPQTSGSEAKNVRMYETHTPGFCYRRNGDIRYSQYSPTDLQSQGVQDVRELLFSNNEIDIEKVLCLHLLAAHSFIKHRHVVQPSFSPSLFSKHGASSSFRSDKVLPHLKRSSLRSANTPTRSFLSSPIRHTKREVLAKKIKIDPSAEDISSGSSNLLPSYVIDFKRKALTYDDDDDDDEYMQEDDYWSTISKEEIEINKQNLDEEADVNAVKTGKPDVPLTKVLTKNEIAKQDNNVPLHMNKQIKQLVDSVIDILQEVNPDKVQEMFRMARQPSALRKLLSKPEIHAFIESLSGKPLMSSWDSFRVSPATIVTIRENANMGELPKDMAEFGNTEEELMVVNLEIADTTISLEKLVCEIRRNVLQEAAKSVLEEESDSLASTSWRNLYRSNSINTIKSSLVRAKTSPIKVFVPQKTEASGIVSSKSIKSIESRNDHANKPTRVTKSPEIAESHTTTPISSGFTLSSYTGFTSSKRLSSNGVLSLKNTGSEDAHENERNKHAKRKKTEDLVAMESQRSGHPLGEQIGVRGAPKLKTNDPFMMRRGKCPVCKERPIVISEYENTQKFVNRKRNSFVGSSSINIIEKLEKPFKEFKERFLNDEFFKTRGLEDLLKTALPSTQQSIRDSELAKARLGYDNYSARFTSVIWDMIRINQTLPSVPLSSQREQVEQVLLQRMTPGERMLVFRKLTEIKSHKLSIDHFANVESIPFASYVLPVLSKKSILRMLEGVEGRVKDIICLSESKGGLGLADYFIGSNNDISNLKGLKSSSQTGEKGSETQRVNSQLTVLDLETLKFEIAKRETHKKYLEFLSKKIP